MRWPASTDDLYVLKCGPDVDGERWGYKIGRTQCLARRVAEHSRNMPFPLETQAVYTDCGNMETRVHRRLAAFRSKAATSREWFCVPWPVIETAILAEIDLVRQNTEIIDSD